MMGTETVTVSENSSLDMIKKKKKNWINVTVYPDEPIH